MVSEMAQPAGGFRNTLNLQEFFRGQFARFGVEPQTHLASSRGGRSWCTWLFVAAFGLLPLIGCQDFNPYLGAASTEASTISFITPSSRPAGCPGFTLDLMGIGFSSTSSVDWNGSPRATNFESSGELLATINDSDLATQATVSIVVDTPVTGQNNQGNNLSNFMSFTVAPTPVQGTANCPAGPTFHPPSRA